MNFDFEKYENELNIYLKDRKITGELSYCITNNPKYTDEFTKVAKINATFGNTSIKFEIEDTGALASGHLYIRCWVELTVIVEVEKTRHKLGNVERLPVWMDGTTVTIHNKGIRYCLEDLVSLLANVDDDDFLRSIIVKEVVRNDTQVQRANPEITLGNPNQRQL